MEQEPPSPEAIEDAPPRTDPEVRLVTQELLKTGMIDLSEKSEIYQAAIRHQTNIEQALEPLDLSLTIDEQRGIMIVSVRADESEDPDDNWNHPLIRRQRLTLEQSLLLAILRQYYVVQELELGTGIETIKMPIDILIDQMFKYLPDSGSDSKNERKILTLIEKLKTHGVVSEPDKNQEITIRPLISHLASPSTLKALLEQLRTLAESETRLDNEQ
ncbi:MAG: DUF4194 domain-containing protein [Rubritalea sp.]|uniref:DUF4194 domain-containing protein n=1 Tax=Rubritalea sp. TaxID=2109375 RepID=UPI003242DCDF